MDYLVLQLTAVFGLVAIAAAYFAGKKFGFNVTDEQMTALREESNRLEEELVQILSEASNFVSKGQLADLKRQQQEFEDAAAQQRVLFDGIAERLDKTRGEVEGREHEQQELRALKEEDQVAISQSLASYNESSAESLALERKLAESLRSIDTMSSEVSLSADQQAIFQELSNALTAASAQLRDVIGDYQTANERLSTLKGRFEDLEKEYTNLVEQQLES
jgi:peptidoglycan hydrolase CwlO-like protein